MTAEELWAEFCSKKNVDINTPYEAWGFGGSGDDVPGRLAKLVREVATKMADYANEEKGKLLKSVQIISFVGVLVLLLSIGLQTYNIESDRINKGVLAVTFIALIVMAIVTLYVTGLLEKIAGNKKLTNMTDVMALAQY